ncbi:transposase [Synechococcus sp. 1G10]|uniref:transposase n=1 Tax=Synechococcus sp. 1G10 TaxID=2025605 RepID=UPI000B997820
MTKPTKTRRRFTAQQKQEYVTFCLQEGLPCSAVARRLDLPSSSLASWVRQARVERVDSGPRDQGLLTTEGSVLSSVGSARRAESSGGRRIFSGWRQRTLQRSSCLPGVNYVGGQLPNRRRTSCRREVSPDQPPGRPLLRLLAVTADWRGLQRLLRLATAAQGAGTAGDPERRYHS